MPRLLLAMALVACLQPPRALGAAPPGAPRSEVKIYDLGLQDVATAEAVARAHLSPEGRVFADAPNHRLIVYDRPDVQARVKAALSVLEISARNVRIQELATDVVVSEGQEIDLGGVPLRDESFRERFLLGIDGSGRTSRHDIRLRATLADR